jgi:hypothetical protein
LAYEATQGNGVESKKTKEYYLQKSKMFEDKFIDNDLKESKGSQSLWDVYQEEIIMDYQSNLQNK